MVKHRGEVECGGLSERIRPINSCERAGPQAEIGLGRVSPY